MKINLKQINIETIKNKLIGQEFKDSNLLIYLQNFFEKRIIKFEMIDQVVKGKNIKGIIYFQDNTSYFIKYGDVLKEVNIYKQLKNKCCSFIKYIDPDILILKDLSEAKWYPFIWTKEKIKIFLKNIKDFSKLNFSNLPHAYEIFKKNKTKFNFEILVIEKYVTERWLQNNLSIIKKNINLNILKGDDVCHGDLHDKNIYFLNNNFYFIDFDQIRRGNINFQIARFLPYINLLNGPIPEKIINLDPEYATLVCCMDVYQCKEMQEKNILIPGKTITSTLPWMIRALKLTPPDGEKADLLLN